MRLGDLAERIRLADMRFNRPRASQGRGDVQKAPRQSGDGKLHDRARCMTRRQFGAEGWTPDRLPDLSQAKPL